MTKPSKDKYSNLQRERQPMPEFVKQALLQNGVLDDYYDRPAYQQNDYLGWIARAKQHTTRDKRLNQMIAELKQGGVYMKMDHPASRKD